MNSVDVFNQLDLIGESVIPRVIKMTIEQDMMTVQELIDMLSKVKNKNTMILIESDGNVLNLTNSVEETNTFVYLKTV